MITITPEERKRLRDYTYLAAIADQPGYGKVVHEHFRSLLDALDAKDAEIERLREALKPFADFANHFDGHAPEIDSVRLCELTAEKYEDDCPQVDDCWEARKALEAK